MSFAARDGFEKRSFRFVLRLHGLSRMQKYSQNRERRSKNRPRRRSNSTKFARKTARNLVKRQGRFGEFISCSNYPKCDYIKRETLGIACPKCKTGEIAVKKSKRGKVFYGCTNYPKCDAVFWDKPDCPSRARNAMRRFCWKKRRKRRHDSLLRQMRL